MSELLYRAIQIEGRSIFIIRNSNTETGQRNEPMIRRIANKSDWQTSSFDANAKIYIIADINRVGPRSTSVMCQAWMGDKWRRGEMVQA